MTAGVSIVIVNHNGRGWLEECLDSIRAQTYNFHQTIFVDNDSSDDSIEFVREHYPEVQIIQSEGNPGFAGGSNLGLQYATGEYVLLLNTDTRLEDDFLENLLAAFDEIPALGAVQPKIRMMDNPDKIQLCGDFWTDSSCLYLYGYGKDENLQIYNRPFPIFAGTGAAMLVRKDALDKVGLFDESFWCYYEDVDLCSRLWLTGYECWYFPRATVYHALGATANNFNRGTVRYHHVKNWLAYMVKNFEGRTLLSALPMFFLCNVLSLVFRLFQGEVEFVLPFLRALEYNLAHIGDLVAKRKTIQSLRKVSDREIFSKVKRNPRLSYYYFLSRGPEKYRDSWEPE